MHASRRVTATAGIPARILINGKEGVTCLMPSVGPSLSNEQIAAVLTYIRRQWGNTADPVLPERIGAARAETASRSRPWSDDELRALASTDR
jgi:mono/diheme cytochrome c family protein